MQKKTINNPSISSMSDFDIISELGKGSFGIVYKVKRKTDNIVYALKKVYLSKLKSKEKENALNEIRLLASINHSNIIEYKDAFYDDATNTLCLVMEFAEEGDLEKKILQRERNKHYYSENEVLSIFIQITKGLKVLHEANVIHRDMKSANIFLFKDEIIKIGDLNVSKCVKKNLKHTQTGTPFYASPEVWDNMPYDHKNDIWSLGCLLYELCALKAPFRGTTMKMVYDKIQRGTYDPIPKFYSKGIGGLIYVCLQKIPLQRPTCNQLLNIIHTQSHTFFSINPGLLLLCNNPKANKANERNIFLDDSNEEEKNNHSNHFLLGTIKMPQRMLEINRVLPKNNYASSASRRIHSASKIINRPRNMFVITQDNNRLSTVHNHSAILKINTNINTVIKNEPLENKFNNMNYQESRTENETNDIKEDIHLSSHNTSMNNDGDNNKDKGVLSPKYLQPAIPFRKINICKKDIIINPSIDPYLQMINNPISIKRKIFKNNIKSLNSPNAHNITDINIIQNQNDNHKHQMDEINGDFMQIKPVLSKIRRSPPKQKRNDYELKPLKSNMNIRPISAILHRDLIHNNETIKNNSIINSYNMKIPNNINTINIQSKQKKEELQTIDHGPKVFIGGNNQKNINPDILTHKENKRMLFNFLPSIDKTELPITHLIKNNDITINHNYNESKNWNIFNEKRYAINNQNQTELNPVQIVNNIRSKVNSNLPVKLCKLPFDKKINYDSIPVISNEVNKIIRGFKIIQKQDNQMI